MDHDADAPTVHQMFWLYAYIDCVIKNYSILPYTLDKDEWWLT